MSRNKAVIGLGFGDEGKGLVTNYLCLQNPEAVVVRYSGGQQAGHTVVQNNKRHVFSNFGSGTLNENPTYWSKYCTVDPVGIVNELDILLSLGVSPELLIDRSCPVTTPFEKHHNRKCDADNGTCGVGVGSTWNREQHFHSILFEDLYHPSVMKFKMDALAKFYGIIVDLTIFNNAVNQLLDSANVDIVSGLEKKNKLIFEGSQGLLLDQHYGFFPNVTRSNVGSKNILKLTKKIPEFYAVTRAYQTRHGNGPMTNESLPLSLRNTLKETNVWNKYQGQFKTSVLDLDLLRYAVEKDHVLSEHRDNLVITCLDQIDSLFHLTDKNTLLSFNSSYDFISYISGVLKFNNVFVSYSDKSELIKKISIT